jgi:uncharacterized caspase-like protein
MKYNRKGLLARRSFVVFSQGRQFMGRKIALVIGNSEYDDASLARLITPSGDVSDLAALLKSPEVGGFDEVLTLVNAAATSVRKAVARLFKDKSPDDLLLLYFSGHGVLDDQGHLHLAVKDTERDLLSGTAIPANFITGEMDRSRSKRQVLVLDCCHSGAFARGGKGVVGATVGTAAAFEGTGYGRVVLTATDATQYAWEGDQVIGKADNSVFTHFMIQGLQTGEADQDQDGRVTLDELYDYVYAQVVAKTPKQTPGKWSYKQQGDIVIAKNPRPPVVKAAELPGELQQAIESPLAYVREGAVRELAQLLRGSNAGLVLAAREALQHLSEDDSRKVSIAAAEALKTVPPAPPLEPLPVQATPSMGAPVARDMPQPVVATAPAATAVPLETKQPAALTSAGQMKTGRQRTAVLAGIIVSIGWFTGWLAGMIIGSLSTESSSGAISLGLGWMAAGVITGLVLKQVSHYAWWPLAVLGAGWPLCLVLTFYLDAPGLILLSVAATWLINSLTAMLAVRNRVWPIAALTTAAAGIAWIIVDNKWDLVALKLFGADYHWAWGTFFGNEPYGAIDLLLIPAVTAAVAGSILTFLLYRRVNAPEPA